MILKPQDIVIALKLIAVGDARWTYLQLYQQLAISASEISAGVRRLAKAHLVLLQEGRDPPKPIYAALKEFLVHGVKYAFPPKKGGLTRGMPTAHAAPPLNREIAQSEEPPPVWPDPDGEVKGLSFEPLYKTVPLAARQDPRLYELLALVDAIRDGRAREVSLAEKALTKRLAGRWDLATQQTCTS